MKKKYIFESIILTFLFFLSDVFAHDTTHIHPLITTKISDLIETSPNSSAYEELFKDVPDNLKDDANPARQRLYWGTDFDIVGILNADVPLPMYLGKDQTDAYLSSFLSGNVPLRKNVMTGVVHEDNPPTKVRHHFYHATDGFGLDVPLFSDELTSAERSMSFFNQGIDAMGGYTEEAKEEAFFLFGQALHHLEDMTSPAHIHNDIHLSILTDFQEEKDDYEGWWLPQQKIICGNDLSDSACGYFNEATSIEPVSNPWNDIWGSSNNSSLVRLIYDSTTYGANLLYPFDDNYLTFGLIGDYYINITRAPDLLPAGELSEMFPCVNDQGQYDENEPECLYWENEKVGELSHWRINVVGDFHHQFDNTPGNSWWPVEFEIDKTPSGPSNARVFSGRYYIEQLSSGNSTSSPEGNPVIPKNMRNNLTVVSSDVETNSRSILDIQASKLLSPAVTYGAGFTKYWYDIANTPPFLERVSAEQRPDAVTTEVVVYDAKWIDVLSSIFSSANTPVYASTTTVNVVDSRTISQSLNNIKHIDANENLIITLEFNEAIKQIELLRIGDFNPDGNCASLINGCVDITPAVPVNGFAPLNVEFGGADKKDDSIWRITVPKSQLNNLNGKLFLTVKAIDKNKHKDGLGGQIGAQLDATPETPAKRNLSNVMDENGVLIPDVNMYPWYVADGLSGKNDKYAYDYEEGDQNHVLLFDTKGPTTSITIDLTL